MLAGRAGAGEMTPGGTAQKGTTSPAPGAPIPVLVTVYPHEEWVRAVGGERVIVTNLVPPGAEPHDFELTARDIGQLRNARLLVYPAPGFQPALDRAVRTLPAGSLRVLNTSAPASSEGTPEQSAARSGASIDHHTWLSPPLAREQVWAIAQALAGLDPAGRAYYEANARAYTARLDRLHEAFQKGLASCQRRVFITSHDAFGHLARTYGLQQVPIAGLSPDEEPSPRRLAELARQAKAHGVRYIFFETLVSPRLAQTLAREVGAQTLVLNPLEGLTRQERAAGQTYFTVMEANLAHLRTGLGCR